MEFVLQMFSRNDGEQKEELVRRLRLKATVDLVHAWWRQYQFVA
jgi:hypothetical protein